MSDKKKIPVKHCELSYLIVRGQDLYVDDVYDHSETVYVTARLNNDKKPVYHYYSKWKPFEPCWSNDGTQAGDRDVYRFHNDEFDEEELRIAIEKLF